MIHPTPINVWYWPTPPNDLYLTPQSVPDKAITGLLLLIAVAVVFVWKRFL